MAGLFIVLEGGEGAGKTGLMGRLASAIATAGHDVLQTREPGGTPEGLALRALLLADQGLAWDPVAELLMMVAARVQHVRRVIEPALAAGRVVLCDRFLASTFAYQGAGRGVSSALIHDLHARAVGGLMPDITVLLDIDPETGLARSRRRLDESRADEGRFEALDLDFHRRVRASFLAQADASTIVVNASRVVDVVAEECVARVLARMAGRGG